MVIVKSSANYKFVAHEEPTTSAKLTGAWLLPKLHADFRPPHRRDDVDVEELVRFDSQMLVGEHGVIADAFESCVPMPVSIIVVGFLPTNLTHLQRQQLEPQRRVGMELEVLQKKAVVD